MVRPPLLAAAAALVCMLLASPVAAAPDRCSDAPRSDFVDRDSASEVHRVSIDCVDHADIANGSVQDGQRVFRPLEDVTRGQMATFIIQTLIAAGYGDELPSGEATEEDPDEFTDIAETVHRERINQLARIGVASGFPDGRYRPGRSVSRQQMATFLLQGAEFALQEEFGPDGSYFGDVREDNVHHDNIDAGYEEALFSGTRQPQAGRPHSGRFSPGTAVRREQMASFLTNLLDRVET